MNKEINNILNSLKKAIEKREKRKIISFYEYLELVKENPQVVLRNIFQLFHDMVKTYVGEGIDEYPDDPESIGFIKYDCSKLLVGDADNPFFADRLFANRFVRHVESLKKGSQQNRIYIFEGPHGCGKSTFMNNLLKKFEEYTETKEGQGFEITWLLDEDDQAGAKKNGAEKENHKKFEVRCPSHDYPILLIPKNYRIRFLDKFFQNNEKMRDVLGDKEYEWIFKGEVCTICKSLFWSLFDKFGSFEKVLEKVYVCSYKFDRRLGEGISVFNPGDEPIKISAIGDRQIQEKLNSILGAGNLVKYVFSRQAKINNGIYVLMDVKSNNQDRLLELHNVISEGVHKVGEIEERINSLFLALMNPEDKRIIEEAEGVESFQERIQYIKIPYVMEPQTEVKIYRSIFGEHIDRYFLPMVLENFARVIISTRMNTGSQALSDWIKDLRKYKRYCDENGLLLRMEIYSGIIPPWLSDEDKRNFTAKYRRRVVAEGEKEGSEGFSGRESIRMFNDFLSRFSEKGNLINMDNVCDFFKKMDRDCRDKIPKEFLGSLLNWYDYLVLSEIKEALYFYNKQQISEDILNFIFATNYEIGAKIKCVFTGKEFEVTKDFFKLIGGFVTGEQLTDYNVMSFVQKIQQKYVEMLTQELKDPDKKDIAETELYKELFESYVKNLKEKVLHPFAKNDNFREAVKAFGTDEFKTFDTRLKDHVSYMIDNLIKKFNYTEQGAKEICLYVLDNGLIEKFS